MTSDLDSTKPYENVTFEESSDHKFNSTYKVSSMRMKPMERYGETNRLTIIENSPLPSGLNSIMNKSNVVVVSSSLPYLSPFPYRERLMKMLINPIPQ